MIPITLAMGLCLAVCIFIPFLTIAAQEPSEQLSVAGEAMAGNIPAVSISAGKSKYVRKMFQYASSVSRDIEGRTTDVYFKWRIHTDRKNPSLFLVPSLYVIAKGNTDYVEEYYTTVKFHNFSDREEIQRANSGTIPHNRKTFPTVARSFTPDIYAQTFFKESILSPFNKANGKYYKYGSSELTDSTVSIAFVPRTDNTQLVKGKAVVDKASGRILSADISGDFDMLTFRIMIVMGDGDSVLPSKCDLIVFFRFTGNKVRSEVSSIFLPPKVFPEVNGIMLPIDSLRPVPLLRTDEDIYARYDSLRKAKELHTRIWEKKLYTVAFDVIGDNLVNNFNKNIGPNDEFSFGTSPLLNPSYLSYSHRKGVIYRFDLKGRYVFTKNSDFHFKVKMGYMFNQKQFYFDAPFTYTYDASRNGTLGFTVGNGNRITNSSVLDQIRRDHPDSIDFKYLKLDYFKDMYMRLNTTNDITDRLSSDVGVVFHQRSPVNKPDFIKVGQPISYRAFAPMVEFTYKPVGKSGPVFTLDYERGIKGVMGSDLDYERWEANGDWMKKLDPLSSLSMRVGYGLYTNRSRNIYFLDFANFRENNLPGGWNDDWSCDFQLLNSAWYNVSKYYLRANLTYEHPMLLASYVPYFGRFIEQEMLYANMLFVDHIHPYMEYGYGFTNRYFSAGVFASTKNWHFSSVGFRFTVEIFGRWR